MDERLLVVRYLILHTTTSRFWRCRSENRTQSTGSPDLFMRAEEIGALVVRRVWRS